MTAQLSLALREPAGKFYVTTRLSATELSRAIAAAKYQEDVVLALYRFHGALTPSKCWELYRQEGRQGTPLTSVRRAISSLTDAGALRKTDTQRPGLYGAVEHVWRLA